MKSNRKQDNRFSCMVAQGFCPREVLAPTPFIQAMQEKNAVFEPPRADRKKNGIFKGKVFGDLIIGYQFTFHPAPVITRAGKPEKANINRHAFQSTVNALPELPGECSVTRGIVCHNWLFFNKRTCFFDFFQIKGNGTKGVG